MGLFGPNWWHHHGIKMCVKYKDSKAITVAATAASLHIWLAHPKTGRPWMVEWKVIQSQTEKTEGTVRFSTEELRGAFGISATIPEPTSQWLFHRYDCECGRQGKYIRLRDFLNIPCPGTGHDGDPNISLELTDEIREAVRQLSE